MEEQKIDLNGLIVVETLPKIRETLAVIADEVDREINIALSLECTKESKKTVKQYRANLNKVKDELESRRKQVKEQIMKPYNDFEDIYEKLVMSRLKNADEMLKKRIDTIEETQKTEKSLQLLDFATEWVKYYGLEDIIDPLLFIPNITPSKSQKSLKEQIKGEIERVVNEIKIMKLEEYGDDILAYYLNNGFDYTKAKLQVIEHQVQKNKVEAMIFTRDNEEEQWKPLNEKITAPVETKEEPKEPLECTFTVWVERSEDLVKIRNFLKELGVKYE